MRTSLIRCAWILAIAGTFGCGSSPLEGEGGWTRQSQSITNGRSSSVKGVGTLFRFEGDSLFSCTASVIGSRTLITAAHCVVSETGSTASFRGGFWLGPGTPNVGELVPAIKAAAHPSYKDRAAADAPMGTFNIAGFNQSLEITRADVAVVTLAQDVAEGPLFDLAAVSPATGTVATLYGAGVTSKGLQDTSLREATNAIEGLTGDLLYFTGSDTFEGNICEGDSGGPSIVMVNARPTIIGVHSIGTCRLLVDGVNLTLGADARVDPYLPWIQEQMSMSMNASTITIDFDEARNQSTSTPYRLYFSVTSTNGIDRVQVWENGRLLQERQYTLAESVPAQQSFSFPSLGTGQHTLEVVVRDLKGSQERQSTTIQVGTSPNPASAPPTGCQTGAGESFTLLGGIAFAFARSRRRRLSALATLN